MVYYNEIDPYAAEWLRNLIKAGHIANGEVDERSIQLVDPADLAGFTQCHFFAGIGVWSYALRLAGWPDDRPVWTGSCPCQPFSAAGKGAGFADERHLWPEFYRLISKRRPPVVFGEQVASKDGLEWLDLVQADLERADYASAAVDICAAGVGAPHIRQRLYWVADASMRGCKPEPNERSTRILGTSLSSRSIGKQSGGICSVSGSVANNNNKGLEGRRQSKRECGTERAAGPSGVVGGLADSDGWDAGAERQQRSGEQRQQQENGLSGGLADAGDSAGQRCEPRATERGLPASAGEDAAVWTGPTNGHWRDADWLFCRDGKWRPVEPGTFPLAHGATSRVGRLRAYGNAIVPQVAQAFIEAFMECQP